MEPSSDILSLTAEELVESPKPKIKYNEGQLKALDLMYQWWKDPFEPFILQGYAGTGKSTIAEEALNRFGIQDYELALIAPTAKAAKVVSAKTGRKATTIHKFRYQPADKEIRELKTALKDCHEELEQLEKGIEGERDISQVGADIDRINLRLQELSKEKARFVKKFMVRRPKLIMVDETSMVSEHIGKDLEELEIPIVYIGDPFQLPPIQAECIWKGRKPDAVLEKIERQGEGSGIVYAAQEVRMGGLPIAGNGFIMHPRGSLPISNYLDADLVLVGTNNLRRDINLRIRSELGYSSKSKYPVVGEKVICLKNDYEYEVSNGEIFTVKEVTFEGKYTIGFILEDAFDTQVSVKCWKALFEDDSKGTMVPEGFVHLTFAHAITVHKSQGSEGKKVVLLDSWTGRQWDRWTYTGITRAMLECHYVSNY